MEEATNARKKAWKLKRDNNTPENRTEYNKLSAKVKLLSKASKKKAWEKTTGNLDLRKDSRKAWTLLDKLSGKHRRTNPAPIDTDKGKAVKSLKPSQNCTHPFQENKKE